jgi:Zn-dependent protease with chaperone function
MHPGRKKKKILKQIFNPFTKGVNHRGYTHHRTDRNEGRNSQQCRFNKRALLALALFLTGASIWFLTPASTLVAKFILLCIPIDDDIALGIESWREMSYNYPIVVRGDRWGVKSIGNELASTLKRNSEAFCSKVALDVSQCKQQMRQYQWSFEVVSSSEVNAFALPGGIVRITDSLLRRLQLTKGEIAGLLGHEMGHVLLRHSQARLLKQNLLEMILKALVYEDGDDHQESFGEALGEMLLSGAKFLGEMRFSRQNEYEADEAAFDILVASQMYDPRAVQSLLEKLWSLTDAIRQDEKGMLGFFQGWDKTHPGTRERIQVLSRLWNELTLFEKTKFRGRLK